MNETLNIARMYYPVKTLGPGDRIGIWVAGCQRNCEGCISPDFQSESSGRNVEVSKLIGLIKEYLQNEKGVTISGGEPFLQPEGLKQLIKEISEYTNDIIIFTGFLYEELVEKNNDDINEILSMVGMIVDGPYIDELNDGTGMRGSSNQRFIILNHPEYYSHPETWKRGIQGAVYGNKIITIGIPDKI